MKPTKQASLKQFLDFLDDQDAKSFKTDSVDRFLRDHEISHEEFLPYTYFREETYGRNLVSKNEHYELLVLTWLPEQRTPIHDHAGQRCWMMLGLGALTFKNFQPLENGKGPLKVAGPTEIKDAGNAAVYIDDGIGIHSIANASRKPAISVHLYAGPIPRCQVYSETLKTMKWVDLEYFTFGGNEWIRPSVDLQ